MKVELEFPTVGLTLINLPWVEYGYFLKPDIIKNINFHNELQLCFERFTEYTCLLPG